MSGDRDVLVARERHAKLICAELNHFTDLGDTLSTVLHHLREICRCGSLAIRLSDEGDYPYFVHDGFSDTFIRRENSLCSRDDEGVRLPDPDGEGFLLDCMCGNIIRGNFDPSQRFFTEGGSFWSNGTSTLLATTSEDERQGHTRNYCNAAGYESVALIPIKARNQILGLIQLNDKTRDRFTPEFIEFMEMIGRQIGLAIQSSMTHERLKLAKEDLERQKDELLQTNADLRTFAHAASHDLVEPLRVVAGFSRLLRQSANQHCPVDALEYLDFIETSVEQMQLLVTRLLDYSRVLSNDNPHKNVNLQATVRGVLRDLSALMEDVQGTVDTGELLPVLGDPVMLRQLLQNLISNALKFTAKGTPAQVTVSTRSLPGGRVAVDVSDQGIGMKEQALDRIFLPFERLHSRDEFPGSGLGLAICQRIAERHSGRISVRSEPGSGSTFTVELPTGSSS